MANNQVGIDIVARATGFQAEFNKIAAGARTAADRMQQSFASMNTAAARFGAVLSVAAIAAYAQKAIAAAEGLQDLADSTGSSVESLSRLNNIVKIGGGNFDEVRTALERLAAGMAGADEESSKVAEALRFLNIQAKDPALALEEIAKKLSSFADGTGKAAIARDLFGKSGVGFLASLKDIADKSDVAATMTTKQAEETTRLAESYRRLSLETNAVSQAFYNDMVPALDRIITRMADASRAAGGFFAGMKLFANAPSWEDTAEGIARVRGEIAKLEALRNEKPFDLFGMKVGGPDLGNLEANLATQRKVLAMLEDRRLKDLGGPPTNERFDKPPLPYRSVQSALSSSSKSKVDEYARALERVSKFAAEANLELEAMFSTRDVTGAQKALSGLVASDEWKNFTEVQRQALTTRYQAIDSIERETAAWKHKREEQEKSIEALQRLAEEQQNAVAAVTADLGQYADENSHLERSIRLVGQDETARQKLAEAIRFESLQKKALLADDQAGLAILDEQYAKRIKLLDEMAAVTKRLAEEQEYNSLAAQELSGALQSVANGTKSIKDAVLDFGKGVATRVTGVVADKLAQSAFGADSGFGKVLADLFGGPASGAATALTGSATTLTGSATALTASAAALSSAAALMGGSSAASSAGGLFGAFGNLFDGGGDILTGLQGFATGTPFVPRTQLALIHKGERIIPAAQNRRDAQFGGRQTIHQTVNILPGATAETSRQALRRATDAASYNRRRGR